MKKVKEKELKDANGGATPIQDKMYCHYCQNVDDVSAFNPKYREKGCDVIVTYTCPKCGKSWEE